MDNKSTEEKPKERPPVIVVNVVCGDIDLDEEIVLGGQ